MPRPRREKAAANTDSRGEMLHKKVATASSGGMPMVHTGEVAARSSEMMLHKKAAAFLNGAATMVHPGEEAAVSGEMATAASSAGVPVVYPEEGAAAAVSGEITLCEMAAASSSGGVPMVYAEEGSASAVSGEMTLCEMAAASSSGGMPMVYPEEGSASAVSGEITLKEMAAAASSGGVPMVYPEEGAGVTVSRLGGAVAQKNATSGGSAALVALHTVEELEESAAKHRRKKPHTVVIPQKHCTEDKPDIGMTEGMLQKEAVTSLSSEMVPEHPVKEADTAKDFQKSDSDEIVHAKEENEELKEAELLIQKLDDLGIGEHVSIGEFNAYFHQLPHIPRIYPYAVELTSEELDKQDARLALYRFRSYKHKVKEEGKADTLGLADVSEDECDGQFFEKWGYFEQIEKNWTLDWYFHPDYCKDPSLSDYQRLVLRNYGGTEYGRWSDYHEFLNSHVVEEEYVNYCEDLFKQLNWMKGYPSACRSSCKWECISSRGNSQALKIAATTFPKISASLAFYGYYECIASMGYDRFWFKELDDVYFEIWQRLTKGTMSFREALEEVYSLDRFPLRQHRMKVALEENYIFERMESEYRACTEDITPEVEDRAKELIAEGIRKRINKPKNYEEYIRKKIRIARVVGILPPRQGLKQQCNNQDSEE